MRLMRSWHQLLESKHSTLIIIDKTSRGGDLQLPVVGSERYTPFMRLYVSDYQIWSRSLKVARQPGMKFANV